MNPVVETCIRYFTKYSINKNVLQLLNGPELLEADTEATFMFDSSLAVKVSLSFRMFFNTISGSGAEHHYHFIGSISQFLTVDFIDHITDFGRADYSASSVRRVVHV